MVTSSGTDTYSAISASIASLKGPRHGGANLKVLQMFDDIKEHCKDWNNEEQIKEYLNKILNREAFDESGLIYGMGHAVYTLSDPRAVILKRYAKKLAEAKGKMDEFHLYETVEEVSKDLIMKAHLRYKPVCANVDFYSGFVYTMLGIPEELFDIDGTLLDEKEGIVPESTVRALHQAKKNGHLLFLCTGRCKSIWPKDILEIGFDGVVGGCGTNIFYHGEELLHATLPKELQREVADSLTRYHIDGVLEGQETAYFRRDYWMPVVKSIFEENGTFSAKCQLFWEDADLNFDKMALWFDESSDMKSFKEQWENTFDFILRDPTFYEVVPKGYSKATGIDFLCKRLEIDRAHTVGIGDSTNDLPMLDFTGISIAMGSGNPDIFPSVDYVTAAVMEDGIEKALKHYQLIE